MHIKHIIQIIHNIPTGTALCTPIFPAIGFVNVCLRVAFHSSPSHEQLLRKLSASIGSILSFACWTVVPFSYEIAPLLLPFALSNGICAGVGYALLDISTGGPKVAATTSSINILKNPILTGGGIGAFTGFVAPNYLYGEAFHILYGMEGVTPLIQQFMAVPFVTGISTTTGFVAGSAMYPLLHYPIFGLEHVPWTYFSGLLLLSSAVMGYTIYNKNDGEKLAALAPDGSFVRPEVVPLLNSIIRFNTQTNKFETFSLSSKSDNKNSWVGPPELSWQGQKVADSMRDYQSRRDSNGEKFTFDNVILGCLCHYFDRGIAERFPNNVIRIRDSKDLKQHRNLMFWTDLSVAFMVERIKGSSSVSLKHSNEEVSSLAQKAIDFLVQNEIFTERKSRKILKSTQMTSLGLELIMTMKQQNIQEIYSEKLESIISIHEIEKWIRKVTPEIILFKCEETDCLKGQSVENQLAQLSWEGKDIKHYKELWEQACVDEYKTRKRHQLVITTGLLASILSGIVYAL